MTNFLRLDIPEISANGGIDSNGTLLGRVYESVIPHVFANSQIAETKYGYTKDRSGDVVSYTDRDDELAAGSGVNPFGTGGTMGVGDSMAFADDTTISDIYVEVLTPGVYDGTIRYGYSSNGTIYDKELTGLVDASNGFRNGPGIYRISFDVPTDIKEFSPAPEEVDSRYYVELKLATCTSVTTAPSIGRVWLRKSVPNRYWHDIAFLYSPLPTDHDFDAWVGGEIFVQIGDEMIFTNTNKFYEIILYIWQRFNIAATYTWYYSSGSGVWSPLTVTDGSNNFYNGPYPEGVAATKSKITWAIPPDWASVENIVPTEGGTLSVTGYQIKCQVTAVSAAPVLPTFMRLRASAFGASNCSGIISMGSAVTFTRCAVYTTNPAGSASTIQFTNNVTGESSYIVIPANNYYNPKLLLSAPLSFLSDEEILVQYVSGGTVGDVELWLQ